MNFKCTKCGHTNSIPDGLRITKCESCGGLFIVPAQFASEENMYQLAGEARARRDFETALAHYEHILEADPSETEAYWGYLLSKYGIELSREDELFFYRTEYSDFSKEPALEKMMETCPQEALYYYEGLVNRISEAHALLLDACQRAKASDVYINCTALEGSPEYALALQAGHALTEAGYLVYMPCLNQTGTESMKNIGEMAAAEKSKAMVVIVSSDTDQNQPRYEAPWRYFLEQQKKEPDRRIMTICSDTEPEHLPQPLQSLPSVSCAQDNWAYNMVQELSALMGRPVQNLSAPHQLPELLEEGERQLQEKDFEGAQRSFLDGGKLDEHSAEVHWGLVRVMTQDLTVPKLDSDLDDHYRKAIQLASDEQAAEYRKAMQNLMGDAVWQSLSEATNHFKSTDAENREPAKEAIERVRLYLPENDPRLAEIQKYHEYCDYTRAKYHLAMAYTNRDKAVQPLFEKWRQIESQYHEFARLSRKVDGKSLQTLYNLGSITQTLLVVATLLFSVNPSSTIIPMGFLFMGMVMMLIWIFTLLGSYTRIQRAGILGFVLIGIILVAEWFIKDISAEARYVFPMALSGVFYLGNLIFIKYIQFRQNGYLKKQEETEQLIKQAESEMAQTYEADMKKLMSDFGVENDTIPPLNVKPMLDERYSRQNVQKQYFILQAVALVAVLLALFYILLR